MDKPLFSILIANYNNGKYLNDAIRSVIYQTYKNWEIIIVDDNSTDSSSEVYSRFVNSEQIRVYYNGQNQGCGYTKRRCVELASGELCGFLDPDDTITPDALEVMVQMHLNHFSAALICSRHNICDEHLNRLWDSAIRDKRTLNYLTERSHSTEVFASFKLNKYRQSKGINPLFKRAVDQDLYYLLEEQGDIIFIDNLLYNYRLHANSITVGHNKALYWHVLAMKEAAERRGLNAEDVVDKVFTDLFTEKEHKIQATMESSYYKLGYIILYPFEKVIRKCRKILKKIF